MSFRVTNDDKLKTLSDEELHRHLRTLKSRIDDRSKRGNNSSNLEIEFCYLQREVSWRRNRKTAHEEYLKKRFPNRPPRRNFHNQR